MVGADRALDIHSEKHLQTTVLAFVSQALHFNVVLRFGIASRTTQAHRYDRVVSVLLSYQSLRKRNTSKKSDRLPQHSVTFYTEEWPVMLLLASSVQMTQVGSYAVFQELKTLHSFETRDSAKLLQLASVPFHISGLCMRHHLKRPIVKHT